MNRLKKAIKIIRGYCSKQEDCDKCRFVDNDGDCMFKYTIPVDWEFPEKGSRNEIQTT